jgi:phosphatidylglycerophosphate synthase
MLKVFGSDASQDSGLTHTFKRHFPNSLTVVRVALAFAFPALPNDFRLAALIIAVLTEWLDGALSRLWSVESTFGRMLDPVADKIFVVAMLATFVWEGLVTLPVVGLVLLRDVTVATACVLVLLFGDRSELFRMPPRIFGKITTAFQFAFLLALLIWQESPMWLTVTTIALSAVAAVDYVRIYFSEIHGTKPESQEPDKNNTTD